MDLLLGILLQDGARQVGGVDGGVGLVGLRSGCAAVVLCCKKGLLFALSFGDDLFDRLVSTLRRLPVGIAEWLVDLVHVQLVEQGLVRVLVRGRSDGRHGGPDGERDEVGADI